MFDIFKEYKDDCFYGIEEVFNGLSEIIKIAPENISSNDIVIDESSFLGLLKEKYLEEQELFKNTKKDLKVIIDFSNVKINDNANIIFTSSKKVDLPLKSIVDKIDIQFNADFGYDGFNFVWDVKQSKHAENVFYEISLLRWINKFEFKSDYFDCIKTSFTHIFDVYFKWNKEYKSDKFRNTFIKFVEGINKNSPNSFFDFYFHIEDEDVLKNICDSGLYEFYLKIVSKVKYFRFTYSSKNNEEEKKFKNLYKDGVKCLDKEIEVVNEKQVKFETDSIFYLEKSDFEVKSLKFKNVDDFTLTFAPGLKCENLIIENVKKFDFKFNVNANKVIKDESERKFPKNVIIRNSKINELYLDEKFIDNLYLLSTNIHYYSDEKDIKMSKIIFENITVKDLYIHSGILPFINNNLERNKDKIQMIFEDIPIDIIFKNVKAENLNIIFSLGDNSIILTPIQDFYELAMITKKDYRFKKYLKNKNAFFEYLLTGTKDSFLFSKLIELANNSIKSKNVKFGMKKSKRSDINNIVFLSKKQNRFLEKVSNHLKEFLKFKEMKDFLVSY